MIRMWSTVEESHTSATTSTFTSNHLTCRYPSFQETELSVESEGNLLFICFSACEKE